MKDGQSQTTSSTRCGEWPSTQFVLLFPAFLVWTVRNGGLLGSRSCIFLRSVLVFMSFLGYFLFLPFGFSATGLSFLVGLLGFQFSFLALFGFLASSP